MGIVESLVESGNPLLKAELAALKEFASLKHVKKDLEAMLAFCIVELKFRPKNAKRYETVVATSNNRFIKVFNAVKHKDKIKMSAEKFIGIYTKDAKSVMTYDLIDGKYKTIPLESWNVSSFIPISENNVLVLDKLVRECLEK